MSRPLDDEVSTSRLNSTLILLYKILRNISRGHVNKELETCIKFTSIEPEWSIKWAFHVGIDHSAYLLQAREKLPLSQTAAVATFSRFSIVSSRAIAGAITQSLTKILQSH